MLKDLPSPEAPGAEGSQSAGLGRGPAAQVAVGGGWLQRSGASQRPQGVTALPWLVFRVLQREVCECAEGAGTCRWSDLSRLSISS